MYDTLTAIGILGSTLFLVTSFELFDAAAARVKRGADSGAPELLAMISAAATAMFAYLFIAGVSNLDWAVARVPYMVALGSAFVLGPAIVWLRLEHLKRRHGR